MSRLFHAQRAMRRKRQAALQRGVVAILDVGTYKTACLVLRFEENTPQGEGVGHMAGQSNFRVIGATTTRSRGIRHGEVDAMPETERAIRTAVQGAQKMANVRVVKCCTRSRSTSASTTAPPCATRAARPAKCCAPICTCYPSMPTRSRTC